MLIFRFQHFLLIFISTLFVFINYEFVAYFNLTGDVFGAGSSSSQMQTAQLICNFFY